MIYNKLPPEKQADILILLTLGAAYFAGLGIAQLLLHAFGWGG